MLAESSCTECKFSGAATERPEKFEQYPMVLNLCHGYSGCHKLDGSNINIILGTQNMWGYTERDVRGLWVGEGHERGAHTDGRIFVRPREVLSFSSSVDKRKCYENKVLRGVIIIDPPYIARRPFVNISVYRDKDCT